MSGWPRVKELQLGEDEVVFLGHATTQRIATGLLVADDAVGYHSPIIGRPEADTLARLFPTRNQCRNVAGSRRPPACCGARGRRSLRSYGRGTGSAVLPYPGTQMRHSGAIVPGDQRWSYITTAKLLLREASAGEGAVRIDVIAAFPDLDGVAVWLGTETDERKGRSPAEGPFTWKRRERPLVSAGFTPEQLRRLTPGAQSRETVERDYPGSWFYVECPARNASRVTRRCEARRRVGP